jgi:hypothetical protein
MFTAAIAWPPSTYTTCYFLLCNSMHTWKFHLSLLCALYIYVHAYFFLLINFYLSLVLVFLFRVYYGFTPLQHRTSQHYTSRYEINLLQILYKHLEYILFSLMKIKIIKFIHCRPCFINGPKFSKFSFFITLHIIIRHLVLVTLERFIYTNS